MYSMTYPLGIIFNECFLLLCSTFFPSLSILDIITKAFYVFLGLSMCKPQKCIIQYDLLKSIKWLRKKVARFYFIMEMKLSYIEEGTLT